MSFAEIVNYTNQNQDIAVAIRPTYINKTSLDNKLDSLLLSSKKNASNDCFIWVYKLIISNDSELEMTLEKYDLTTISEVGIVRKLTPDQSQIKLVNVGLKIKPKSVFEANDVISLSCRSGVMYGECVFRNKEADVQYKIKIPPISLDSGDSKNMAN